MHGLVIEQCNFRCRLGSELERLEFKTWLLDQGVTGADQGLDVAEL